MGISKEDMDNILVMYRIVYNYGRVEEQWQKERKRIRELQDRHFREKGDERE